MKQLPWEKDELVKQPNNKEQNMNDIIYKLDIKVKELDTRLNSLENLCNQIHNQYGVWWEIIEDDKNEQ